jgi:hypothetical protein
VGFLKKPKLLFFSSIFSKKKMETLPTELVLLIIGPATDFNPDDHDNARLVCKSWRVAIPRRKSPLMFKSVSSNWQKYAMSPFVTNANLFTFGGPLLDAAARVCRLTLAEITAMPELPHDWAKLSYRADLTPEFIIAHADRAWNFSDLSRGGTARLHEAVDALPHKPWLFWYLTGYSQMSESKVGLICRHPDKMWDWYSLSQWKNDHINTLITSIPHNLWPYEVLSRNPNVNEETVLKLPDKPWNLDEFISERQVSTRMAIFLDRRGIYKWNDVKGRDYDLILQNESVISHAAFRHLSYSRTIDYAVVVKLAHKPWEWHALSSRDDLDMAIVKTHPHLPWSVMELSTHPSLDMTIVAANPEKAWSWSELSAHRRLSIEIVVMNPEKSWDWPTLTRNTAIPFETMLQQPQLPWDF